MSGMHDWRDGMHGCCGLGAPVSSTDCGGLCGTEVPSMQHAPHAQSDTVARGAWCDA